MPSSPSSPRRDRDLPTRRASKARKAHKKPSDSQKQRRKRRTSASAFPSSSSRRRQSPSQPKTHTFPQRHATPAKRTLMNQPPFEIYVDSPFR